MNDSVPHPSQKKFPLIYWMTLICTLGSLLRSKKIPLFFEWPLHIYIRSSLKQKCSLLIIEWLYPQPPVKKIPLIYWMTFGYTDSSLLRRYYNPEGINYSRQTLKLLPGDGILADSSVKLSDNAGLCIVFIDNTSQLEQHQSSQCNTTNN